MAEDQTRMAFMSDADEKFDPVSGNDVPPGSLPEEVRDDIDARLSEGEYVVPADVVRFFGVKFFEDLRTQAKRGLSSMEEDGRIGGEPVSDDLEAMQMDQEIDAMIAAEMNGMAEGGEVKQYALGGLEEGKNDELVKGVLDMVQQQPALQQMLATKGLKINTTGANKTADQLEEDNMPNKTTEPVVEDTKEIYQDSAGTKSPTVGMAEGGMAKGSKSTKDPFDFEIKAKASAEEGDNITPAEIKTAMLIMDQLPQYKGLYNSETKYAAAEGTLVTNPEPTFDFNDWRTLGFTPSSNLFSFISNNTVGLSMIKYVNGDGKIMELAKGTKPPAGYSIYTPAASSSSDVISNTPVTKVNKDGKPMFGRGELNDLPKPNYMISTTEELQAAMESSSKVNKLANIGSALGPIGLIGSLIVKASMREDGIAIGVAAAERLKGLEPNDADFKKLTALVEKGKLAAAGPLGSLAAMAGKWSARGNRNLSGLEDKQKFEGRGGIYGRGQEGITDTSGLWEIFTGEEYGAFLDRTNKERDEYGSSDAGGYATGNISGVGGKSGVVTGSDNKVIKVRDLDQSAVEGYSGSDGATVFRNNDGSYYTKTFFGKKVPLNYTGSEYSGPEAAFAADMYVHGDEMVRTKEYPGGIPKYIIEQRRRKARDETPVVAKTISSSSSSNSSVQTEDGNQAEIAASTRAEQVAAAKKATAEANANVDYTPSAGGFGKGEDRYNNKVEYDSDFYNKGGLLKKKKTKSYANGGYVTANEPAKTKKKKSKGLGTRP